MKMKNTILEVVWHKYKTYNLLIKRIGIAVLFLAVVSFIYFLLPTLVSQEYNPTAISGKQSNATSLPEQVMKVTHIPTPDQVKGVYMTACAAKTSSFREHITSLLEETELNTVIIDIKDFTGTISAPLSSELQQLNEGATGCRVPDMQQFIGELHDRGVYVIGRITAFQDPFYSKTHPEIAIKKRSTGTLWHDNKGLSYIDPGARAFWDYLVEIGKESYEIGFDELNYDYIRYPSDGNVSDAAFPHSQGRAKPVVIREFFEYLNTALDSVDAPVSADIFGMTTTATTSDLNIGQLLGDALATFDYVAPMVYPSHYPSGYQGFANPAAQPYEVVSHSMGTAVLRARNMAQSTSTPPAIRSHVSAGQLRPWLQDFDLGADYTAEMVRAQIQATYDVGLDSWMLWDSRNRYTREALQPVATSTESTE